MKKIIILLSLLFFPFLVSASNIEDVKLKWSKENIEVIIDDMFLTKNNVVFYNSGKIYSFNKSTGKKNSINAKSINRFFSTEDNGFIVTDQSGIYKIDENLKILKKHDLTNHYNIVFEKHNDYIFLSTQDTNNIRYIYKLDYNLNIIAQDNIQMVAHTYLKKENGVYKFYDSYKNNFYITEDFKIVSTEVNEDGSFILFKENYIYKYDKDKKLIKTLNFNESGTTQSAFEYQKHKNKYYVTSISIRQKESSPKYYYYKMHIYLVDEDLNILKENSISNPNLASSNTDTYYYSSYIYLNNDNIYVYDGPYITKSYYKVDENLKLTISSKEEAVPAKTTSTTQDSTPDVTKDQEIQARLDDLFSKEITNNRMYYYYSYQIDDDENILVSVKYYDNSNSNRKSKAEVLYLDKNYNEIFRNIIFNWESLNMDNYQEYDEYYPCFDKGIEILSDYFENYIVVTANSPSSSYIYILDKEGNIKVDLSKDLASSELRPFRLKTNKHSLAIYLDSCFSWGCPESGYKENPDEYWKDSRYDADYIYSEYPYSQFLYYELPYIVKTKTDGNGTVEADHVDAEDGIEVKFTVKPKEGYVLGEVKVTDQNGNIITFTDYTFTMPSADVTIEASFIPIPKEDNPETSDYLSIYITAAILIVEIVMIVYFSKKSKDE